MGEEGLFEILIIREYTEIEYIMTVYLEMPVAGGQRIRPGYRGDRCMLGMDDAMDVC
jgi:hypothetical protein